MLFRSELTNKQITEEILRLLNKDESSILYVEDRKGHDLRYSINCEKISNELGYSAKVKLVDGLSQTIEWYSKNKAWWEPLKQK